MGSRAPDAVDRWRIFFDPAINSELRQYAGTATFINPLQRLCTDADCPYRRGDRYLYEDAEHFSVYGSDLAVAAYFPLLNDPPMVSEQLSGRSD